MPNSDADAATAAAETDRADASAEAISERDRKAHLPERAANTNVKSRVPVPAGERQRAPTLASKPAPGLARPDHPTERIVHKSEQFGLVMNSNGIMK